MIKKNNVYSTYRCFYTSALKTKIVNGLYVNKKYSGSGLFIDHLKSRRILKSRLDFLKNVSVPFLFNRSFIYPIFNYLYSRYFLFRNKFFKFFFKRKFFFIKFFKKFFNFCGIKNRIFFTLFRVRAFSGLSQKFFFLQKFFVMKLLTKFLNKRKVFLFFRKTLLLKNKKFWLFKKNQKGFRVIVPRRKRFNFLKLRKFRRTRFPNNFVRFFFKFRFFQFKKRFLVYKFKFSRGYVKVLTHTQWSAIWKKFFFYYKRPLWVKIFFKQFVFFKKSYFHRFRLRQLFLKYKTSNFLRNRISGSLLSFSFISSVLSKKNRKFLKKFRSYSSKKKIIKNIFMFIYYLIILKFSFFFFLKNTSLQSLFFNIFLKKGLKKSLNFLNIYRKGKNFFSTSRVKISRLYSIIKLTNIFFSWPCWVKPFRHIFHSYFNFKSRVLYFLDLSVKLKFLKFLTKKLKSFFKRNVRKVFGKSNYFFSRSVLKSFFFKMNFNYILFFSNFFYVSRRLAYSLHFRFIFLSFFFFHFFFRFYKNSLFILYRSIKEDVLIHLSIFNKKNFYNIFFINFYGTFLNITFYKFFYAFFVNVKYIFLRKFTFFVNNLFSKTFINNLRVSFSVLLRKRVSKVFPSWAKAKQRYGTPKKIRFVSKQKNMIKLKKKSCLRVSRSSILGFFLQHGSLKNNTFFFLKNSLFFEYLNKFLRRRSKLSFKKKPIYLQDPVFVSKSKKRFRSRLVFLWFKAKKWSIHLNNKFSTLFFNKAKSKRSGYRLSKFKNFFFIRRLISGRWVRRKRGVFKMRKVVQKIFYSFLKKFPKSYRIFLLNFSKYSFLRDNSFLSLSNKFFNNTAILVYRLGYMPSLTSAVEAVRFCWFCLNFELVHSVSSLTHLGDILLLYPSFFIFSNFVWLKFFYISKCYSSLVNLQEYYQSKKPFVIFAIKMTNLNYKSNFSRGWIKLVLLKNLRLMV